MFGDGFVGGLGAHGNGGCVGVGEVAGCGGDFLGVCGGVLGGGVVGAAVNSVANLVFGDVFAGGGDGSGEGASGVGECGFAESVACESHEVWAACHEVPNALIESGGVDADEDFVVGWGWCGRGDVGEEIGGVGVEGGLLNGVHGARNHSLTL